MTSTAVLSALESNRRFTELKDAQSRLSQAQRDLEAKVISTDEYQEITEMCIKIILASQD